jgi:hypothetical protein
MLASFYCQELIRNTHLLCLSYIIKLSGVQPPENSIPGTVPYYVEENEKLLNLLITNCEPILRELETRFDQFNTYNRIHDGFAELHQPSCEADSGPELLEELQ